MSFTTLAMSISTGFAYGYDESEQVLNCLDVMKISRNKFEIFMTAMTMARSVSENLFIIPDVYTGWIFHNPFCCSF